MISCALMLLGCRGAGLFGPHLLTRDQKFEGATSSLREQVQVFGAAPGTVDDASTRRAVSSMADAIANVPDSQGVDVAAAARNMRTDYVDVAGATGGPASAHLRRVLMVAAGAMALLAHGPYVGEPAVARRVAVFEQVAAELNPDEAIEAQRQVVVRAFAGAGAALASIERAAGIGPAAVVPAPNPASP